MPTTVLEASGKLPEESFQISQMLRRQCRGLPPDFLEAWSTIRAHQRSPKPYLQVLSFQFQVDLKIWALRLTHVQAIYFYLADNMTFWSGNLFHLLLIDRTKVSIEYIRAGQCQYKSQNLATIICSRNESPFCFTMEVANRPTDDFFHIRFLGPIPLRRVLLKCVRLEKKIIDICWTPHIISDPRNTQTHRQISLISRSMP